ncbi:MAG: hypothetical protein ABEJ26_10740 [Halosimplex sp.]
MTGKTRERVEPSDEAPLGTLDADSVERIDVHLKRALAATEDGGKDFHVRHARQLLEALRD